MTKTIEEILSGHQPPRDLDLAATSARRLLAEFTPAPLLDSAELEETPRRVARAWSELLSGYAHDPADVLAKQFAATSDGIVVVRDIGFVSVCEHHVLPFVGVVHVAYVPNKKIVGLSKIPRAVRILSRRLQVQERLTMQIALAIERALEPRAVGVVVVARHACMTLRGAEAAAETLTSEMLGGFRQSEAARAEVMALMGIRR